LSLPYEEDEAKDFSDILTDFFIPSIEKNMKINSRINTDKHTVLLCVSSPMSSMSQNEFEWGKGNDGKNISIHVDDNRHTMLSTLESPISTVSHNDYEQGFISENVSTQRHDMSMSIDTTGNKHTILPTMESPVPFITENKDRYVLCHILRLKSHRGINLDHGINVDQHSKPRISANWFRVLICIDSSVRICFTFYVLIPMLSADVLLYT
jgi:hypothetical protein